MASLRMIYCLYRTSSLYLFNMNIKTEKLDSKIKKVARICNFLMLEKSYFYIFTFFWNFDDSTIWSYVAHLASPHGSGHARLRSRRDGETALSGCAAADELQWRRLRRRSGAYAPQSRRGGYAGRAAGPAAAKARGAKSKYGVEIRAL